MSQLARIIRNEKYTNIINKDGSVYTKVIPPIVDEKLFKKCNLSMDRHKHKQRKQDDKPHCILNVKLFCLYCFSAMTAETGTSKISRFYRYYKCYGKKIKTNNYHEKNVS